MPARDTKPATAAEKSEPTFVIPAPLKNLIPAKNAVTLPFINTMPLIAPETKNLPEIRAAENLTPAKQYAFPVINTGHLTKIPVNAR